MKERKIGVIGAGFVGLVTAACLSKYGNKVICADKDSFLIDELCNGIVRIHEPKLHDFIDDGIRDERLSFTNDIPKLVKECDYIFITVNTPTVNGKCDITNVKDVAKLIRKNIDHDVVVINKSTSSVGTAEEIEYIINSGEGLLYAADVLSNPEFLKEGSAVDDFLNQDRIVIGSVSTLWNQLRNDLIDLYRPFIRNRQPILFTDSKSAEMIKYAANSMLASRISFINEIANICDRVGADIEFVKTGIGYDPRIGFEFLNPGCGYGGSCFPKDVKALIGIAEDYDYNASFLKAIDHTNEKQKDVIVDKIVERLGSDLSDYVFAVWGLSFKPNTSDIRESISIYTIERLLKFGASRINVHDPAAIDVTLKFYNCGHPGTTSLTDDEIGKIHYCSDKYFALKGADVIVIMTDWDEYKLANFNKIKACINPSNRKTIIFDGRNIFVDYLKSSMLEEVEYHYIGGNNIDKESSEEAR